MASDPYSDAVVEAFADHYFSDDWRGKCDSASPNHRSDLMAFIRKGLKAADAKRREEKE